MRNKVCQGLIAIIKVIFANTYVKFKLHDTAGHDDNYSTLVLST